MKKYLAYIPPSNDLMFGESTKLGKKTARQNFCFELDITESKTWLSLTPALLVVEPHEGSS